MMKKVILAILLLVVQSAILKRVNDLETPTITTTDSVVSTLGMFRFNLKNSNCSLYIEKFNAKNSAYEPYSMCSSPTFNSSCQSLYVKNGQILTNTGALYFNLQPGQYQETAITIDDTGIVRLQGIRASPVPSGSKQFDEALLHTLQTTNPLIESHPFLNVSMITNYTETNTNGWQVNITNGQLTVSSFKNPSIFKSYPFKNIIFNQTGIFDLQGNAISSLGGSGQSTIPSGMKYPYTFEFDSYWPIFRIYTQTKVLIVEYSLFVGISQCPEATFAFNSNCTLACPVPYFPEMDGYNGKCVLTADPGFVLNPAKRIYSNPNNKTIDYFGISPLCQQE